MTELQGLSEEKPFSFYKMTKRLKGFGFKQFSADSWIRSPNEVDENLISRIYWVFKRYGFWRSHLIVKVTESNSFSLYKIDYQWLRPPILVLITQNQEPPKLFSLIQQELDKQRNKKRKS